MSPFVLPILLLAQFSSEIPGCHQHDCAYTACSMQAKQPFIQGDTVTFLPLFLLVLSEVETLTLFDSRHLIEALKPQCLIIPCSLRGCKNATSAHLPTASLCRLQREHRSLIRHLTCMSKISFYESMQSYELIDMYLIWNSYRISVDLSSTHRNGPGAILQYR